MRSLLLPFCLLAVESDAPKKTKKSVPTVVDASPISLKEVTLETTASLVKSPPSMPHSTLFEHPVFNELESIPTTEAAEEMPFELSEMKPDEESYNSLTCPYRQICERFLNTLSLPGNNQ